MTDYEENLISIFNGRSLEELRLMLQHNSKEAAYAAKKFNETGLSKYKEDKEHYASGCNVLKFVIANQEFYNVDTVIDEIN